MSATEDLLKLEQQAVQLTETWLQKVVIEHDFCPFAAYPLSQGAVRTAACFESSRLECAFFFKDEIVRLLDRPATELETSLLVLSDTAFSIFEDLLEFVDDMKQFLNENELDGVFQLVAFHPDYQFEGESIDGRSNYTNRSPFPMIHVIREDSMAKAIEKFGEDKTDQIPSENISKLETMSDESFEQNVLRYCKRS